MVEIPVGFIPLKVVELEDAIDKHRTSLAHCIRHEPRYQVLAQELGMILHEYFRFNGGTHHLDEAIGFYRTTLEFDLTPLENITTLNALGSALHDRYIQLTQRPDLEEAILTFRTALDSATRGNVDVRAPQCGLGIALLTLSRGRPFDDEPLNEVIKCFRLCLETPCLDDSQSSRAMIGLSDALSLRYWATGEDRYLEEAIELARHAIILTSASPGSLDLISSLLALGTALKSRFVKHGVADDATEAKDLYTQVIQVSTGSSYPEHWWPLCLLADLLVFQGVKMQSATDLSEARNLALTSATLCPETHFYRGRVKRIAGVSYQFLYTLLGSEDYIHHAIALYREWLAADPATDAAVSLHATSNLSLALMYRFRVLGQLGDLEEAISLLTVSLESTPRSYVDYHNMLQNLANLHGARFKVKGEVADNEECIRLRRETLTLCPIGDIRRPLYLGNLALTLSSAAEKRGLVEYLTEAAQIARETYRLVPQEALYKFGALGDILRLSWKHGVDPEGLNDAIDLHERSITVLPQSDPTQSERFLALAEDMYTRFRATGHRQDFERCMSLCRNAVDHQDSWTRDRFEAALDWALHAEEVGDMDYVSEAYRRAVSLFPRIAYLALDPKQRLDSMKVLQRLPGLVQKAALHFLGQDLPQIAVTLLEEGRLV
jgi:tetratricopeptide (TPR) repeat protein